MTRTLTLNATVQLDGGTITLDLDGVDLDPGRSPLVLDVLARVLGFDRIDQARAKAICAKCPHTAPCLGEALSLPVSQDQGVRAGLTERQRRRMPRRRP